MKKKLSSRKFWVAIGGFITALLVAFAVPQGTIQQISAIISSFGCLIAYILGEAYADGKHNDEIDQEDEEE